MCEDKGQTAEGKWSEICANQGWNEESKISLLEEFLRKEGLFDKFSAFAQEAADNENDQ